jgi:hypothetical protein
VEGDGVAQVVQIFGGISFLISSFSDTKMIIQIERKRRTMTIVSVKIRSR